MKIDWTTVMAVAIGTILASVISKLVLNKITDKLGAHLESSFDDDFEQ